MKKIASFMLSLLLLMSISDASVQAVVNTQVQNSTTNDNVSISTFASNPIGNINIISSTSITVEDAQSWARGKGATETFVNLAPLYEKYAKDRGGINWALAYVQAAKETGYGRFGGVLDESFFNPCGLKNPQGGGDYDPNAHKRFDNWEQGVIAHLDHLALYAGASGYPKTVYVDKWKETPLQANETYDPRHTGWYSDPVNGILGKVKTTNELGGRWAPSATYGVELFRMYCDITKSEYLPARSNLEAPNNGIIIKDDKLQIKGWGLHAFGIKEVRVLIDNVFVGNVTKDISRPDVNQTFPGYFNGSNSGFESVINITNITNGAKKLTVQVVANDGTVENHYRDIVIDRDLHSLPIRGNVDEPSFGATINKNTLTVRGWVVSGREIKEVKVYVDGKYKGNATTKLSRPDIENVFPTYPNSLNSGFQGDFDISDISNGSKKVSVEAVTIDNAIFKMETTMNVSKLQLRSWLDTPVHNSTIVSNSIIAEGWALNPLGVKEIKATIDGINVGTFTTNIPRNDVNTAYPGYVGGDKAGFKATLDITNIQNGNKKLILEIVGNDNSVQKVDRDIIINKVKLSPKSWLDTPVHKSTITTSTLIAEGWALNPSGIKEIKATIDGVNVGTFTTNIVRNDVNTAYPGYPGGDKSGFKATLDISAISNGDKKLILNIIGNDGSVQSVDRDIVVNKVKLAPRSWLDSPVHRSSIASNTLIAEGWALNPSGVKEIKATIDGINVGIFTTNIVRNDVNNAYPGYIGGDKSGFKATLDISAISNGDKKLILEIVGNDGTVQKVDRDIIVNKVKLAPKSWLDNPTHLSNITTQTIVVEGWALNPSGVKEIKASIDGKNIGTFTTNIIRNDVNNAYPGYIGGDKSGFKATLDISSITNGTKKLILEIVGNDNSVQKVDRDIVLNKVKLEPKGWIETPIHLSTIITSTISVEGWALNPSGVKEIKASIDGINIGTFETEIVRKDVNSAYPGYPGGEQSGFKTTLDISSITNGSKKLILEVYGNDGSIQKLDRDIIVNEPILKSRNWIDAPQYNEVIRENTLYVKGWALNSSGVKEIRVLVDEKLLGNATIGLPRNDVNQAYPGYPGGDKAGFEGTFNIEGIEEGKKLITFEIVANDNSVEKVNSYCIFRKGKLIVIDPGHENPGADPGAIGYHNNNTLKFVEADMNLIIAEKLKVELEKRGYQVVMTRSTGSGIIDFDWRQSLRKRVDLANSLNADFFLSIHHNSGGGTGIEAWYSIQTPTPVGIMFSSGRELSLGRSVALFEDNYKISKSREMATLISQQASSLYGLRNRGPKFEPIGVPDFYVTKNTTMPSIILENGFVDSLTDMQIVSTLENQQKLAELLANIIASSI